MAHIELNSPREGDGGFWVVWKFGGTSVGTAPRLLNVRDLVLRFARAVDGDGGPSLESSSPKSADHRPSTLDASRNPAPAQSAVASDAARQCLSSPLLARRPRFHSLDALVHPAATPVSSWPDSEWPPASAGAAGLIVVLSAMAGVTNLLEKACRVATGAVPGRAGAVPDKSNPMRATVETASGDAGSDTACGNKECCCSGGSVSDFVTSTDCEFSVGGTSRAGDFERWTDPSLENVLREIEAKHVGAVEAFARDGDLGNFHAAHFREYFNSSMAKLRVILSCMSLTRVAPSELTSIVLGFGELWSSTLLVSLLKSAAGPGSSQAGGGGSGGAGSGGVHPSANDETGATAASAGKGRLLRPSSRHFINFPSPVIAADISWLDSRKVIYLLPPEEDSAPSTAPLAIDYRRSQAALRANLERLERFSSDGGGGGGGAAMRPPARTSVIVMPGFVCSAASGVASTLQRNGSDYSGAILAHLVDAAWYTVWTDVPGIFTADPAKVPGAFRVNFLSYREAIELAYFGAKVIHPLTMDPCVKKGVPIVLRSSFEPETPGTLIAARAGVGGGALPPARLAGSGAGAGASHTGAVGRVGGGREGSGAAGAKSNTEAAAGGESGSAGFTGFAGSAAGGTRGRVKGFSIIEDISLVTVCGAGMVGLPGVASRIFGAVQAANISVIMISQAGSEHSVCFAVPAGKAAAAVKAITAAFYREITCDHTMSAGVTEHCALISAVGERMCGAVGLMARLLSAIAAAGVSIRAAAQGCTEINITLVVAAADAAAALQAMHRATFETGNSSPARI